MQYKDSIKNSLAPQASGHEKCKAEKKLPSREISSLLTLVYQSFFNLNFVWDYKNRKILTIIKNLIEMQKINI